MLPGPRKLRTLNPKPNTASSKATFPMLHLLVALLGIGLDQKASGSEIYSLRAVKGL